MPPEALSVPVGVSNRHVRLTKAHFEALFGPGRQGTAAGWRLFCGKNRGERAVIFGNVLVRAGPSYVPEFHIDWDKANAACLKTEDAVTALL